MKKVKGSYLFKVTGEDGKTGEWLVDLKTGNGSVTKNPGDHNQPSYQNLSARNLACVT